MMFIEEPKDWRDLLRQITSDPDVLQHILQELTVQEVTIKRWINGTSEPRIQNLRRLLHALPEYREQFLEFFAETFENFSDISLEPIAQEIPSQFYMQVFQTHGTIGHTQRFWSLTNTIINQGLEQLDPEKLGVAMTVVRCMKCIGRDKVYSLRQTIGQATPPWPGNLEQKAMFLGAESLAGYAVATCRPSEVQNYKNDSNALPGHQFEEELSAIAHPILYAGRIAGCLLVSCREPSYFCPPARMNLVADYAHLIALAFNPEDFINLADLELRVMPSHTEQKEFFSTFRNRITAARLKLYELKLDIDAEQYVWEELERELLAYMQKKFQADI